MFSNFVGYIFTSLIMSFEGQKLLILMKSNYTFSLVPHANFKNNSADAMTEF